MSKLREQLEEILRHKDDPKFQKLIEEAEEIKIPKKYNSFRN